MKGVELEYEIYLSGAYKETRQLKTFCCYPDKFYKNPENEEQIAFNRNKAISLLENYMRHQTCLGDICIKII